MSELYLHLFNGRHEPDQVHTGPGFDGPWIGPLVAAHTTQSHRNPLRHIRLTFVCLDDAQRFGLDRVNPYLILYDDLICHNGCYYADWVACLRDAVSEPASPQPIPHLQDGVALTGEHSAAPAEAAMPTAQAVPVVVTPQAVAPQVVWP